MALLIGPPVYAAGKSAAVGSIFVSPPQLRELTKNPGVKVIDVRSAGDYAKGHIPGAISIPWHTILVPERDGFRNKWADDTVIEEVFARAGLAYADYLVLYHEDALGGGIPFVIFSYAGFDELHALDGGINAWDGKIDAVSAAPSTSKFTMSRKQGAVVVDKDYVAGKIGDPAARIVEGRNRQAYEDGHIPTAVHVCPDTHMDENKFLKPRDVILKNLAEKGVTPEKEIILYCGSGGASSRNFMALKEVGFNKVVVYVKSWDEWSIDTTKVQELGVPNLTFAGSALTSKNSLGPRFFSQSELESALGQNSVVVLDVRSPDDYRIGRIPGSVNVYWNDTLDANRNPKSPEELSAMFAKQGVAPGKHIVVFTRGGVQLAYMYTLLRVLGYPQVSAYTGRWDGWFIPSWEAAAGT
ncbi:MAG: sulfurtransferase [Thermodesulfobacteriota bacterium]